LRVREAGCHIEPVNGRPGSVVIDSKGTAICSTWPDPARRAKA
jgi:hypothetical protein